VSDIDTVLVDSLKALDSKRPIREADTREPTSTRPLSANRRHLAQLAAPRKIDGKATDEFAAVKPARDTPAFDKLDDVGLAY
jgi:hypothetical protein